MIPVIKNQITMYLMLVFEDANINEKILSIVSVISYSDVTLHVSPYEFKSGMVVNVLLYDTLTRLIVYLLNEPQPINNFLLPKSYQWNFLLIYLF